jgi:hypothetical protein
MSAAVKGFSPRRSANFLARSKINRCSELGTSPAPFFQRDTDDLSRPMASAVAVTPPKYSITLSAGLIFSAGLSPMLINLQW